jgi:hypothetical protein
MDRLCQFASAGLAVLFAAALYATSNLYIEVRSERHLIKDSAGLAALELSRQKLRLALPHSP